MTDDGDELEQKVKDDKNHQCCQIKGYRILQPSSNVLIGQNVDHILFKLRGNFNLK